MASILDRYGIKEVSDVTFYEIGENGKPTRPVLFLDTLKTSTIEQSAESSDATGGKGNARLITWDTNKEINVSLEDALFSPKSLAIMFGDGTVGRYQGTTDNPAYIMKTENFVATSSAATASASNAGWVPTFRNGSQVYAKVNPKFYDELSQAVTSLEKDKRYFCSYDLVADGMVIEVGANTFPGTYYIVGDTYSRNATTGKDEFFQWIVPKAKITSQNTITMEASGDPSVFNLNLSVLRPDDGIMMKLVKYDLENASEDVEVAHTVELAHNHDLATN